jgi:hypothetical protein
MAPENVKGATTESLLAGGTDNSQWSHQWGRHDTAAGKVWSIREIFADLFSPIFVTS